MDRYCKWYCDEWVDHNKWMYISSCGERREVSRDSKFFKFIHADSNANLCPNCNKPITIGELM